MPKPPKNLGTLLMAVACGLVTGACGGSLPTAGTPPPAPPPTTLFVLAAPMPLAPGANTMISQNNTRIGCSFDVHAGAGFEINFSWTAGQASAMIRGYELNVERQGAALPAVSTLVGTTQYSDRQCNAFVIDQNRDGWGWKVRTIDGNGNRSEWSTIIPFSFKPCRIGTVPCA
jgi:hypothetical protein